MAEQKKKTIKKQTFTEATGRRREATARVRLYPVSKTGSITMQEKQYKAGDIMVNDKRIQEYFPGAVNQKIYMAPLRATNTADEYVISGKTQSGGIQGQLDALVHAISRALDKIDSEKYHSILKKRGFLMRDPRMKERRKAGLAQKARAKKSSPKR